MKEKIKNVLWEASLIPTGIELQMRAKKLEREEKKEKKRKEAERVVLPIIVSDLKGLNKAVSDCEKVIIVNNTDLFSAIKRDVNKDVSFDKGTKKACKISALVTLGATIGSVFAPPLGLVMVAGSFATIASGELKLASSLVGKMRKYTWMESDDKKLLILIKCEGENRFDEIHDIVDYEHVRKCEV